MVLCEFQFYSLRNESMGLALAALID
jgi:hypothetical protein